MSLQTPGADSVAVWIPDSSVSAATREPTIAVGLLEIRGSLPSTRVEP